LRGREAPTIMKYYISLAIVVVMGLAIYQSPVEAPVEAEPVKPVAEPVGVKEPVGAKSEPPAGSF